MGCVRLYLQPRVVDLWKTLSAVYTEEGVILSLLSEAVLLRTRGHVGAPCRGLEVERSRVSGPKRSSSSHSSNLTAREKT